MNSIPFALLSFSILVSSCSPPSQITEPPSNALFTELPATLTVKQRSSTFVPGTRDGIRVTVEDITRGQVLTSLASREGATVLAPVSLRQGQSANFVVSEEDYQLTLRTLRNNLIGEDFATFVISPSGTEAEMGDRERIEFLITCVDNLEGAVFIRNGVEHLPSEAAEHLRTKWNAAGMDALTAEEFITKIASHSSLSHEPYQIRLSDGAVLHAGEYLQDRLREWDETRGKPPAPPPHSE